MKRLIVGFDLSKGALHAFHYSLKLARKTQSSIRLVWVDNYTSNEAVFSRADNANRSEAKRNIESLIAEFQPDQQIGHLDYRLMKGKVGQELARQAKDYNADAIIVGTHGITGYEEYWIGSNANRVVIYSDCPVVTVRYDYDVDADLKRIIMPIDHTQETLQKLPAVVAFAKLYDAEVYLLGLYSTILKSMHKKVEERCDGAFKFLQKHGIVYHKECLQSENIARDVLSFSNKINANMIAIITERKASSNMLLGEYAQKIVNHSNVPVLSIRSKDQFILQ